MDTVIKHKSLIMWLAVVVWLGIIAVTFWWFEFRVNRQIDFTQEHVFDSRKLSDDLLLMKQGSTGITVIHYFDDACPCTKFNSSHVLDLMNRYEQKDVYFLILAADMSSKIKAEKIFNRPVTIAESSEVPVASPSAVVINNGEVSYIGPYSPGAVCSTAAGDFVGLVLNDLLAKQPFKQAVNLASGCFCDWPV